MKINRRTAMLGGAAAVAVLSSPAIPNVAAASPEPAQATMFYTVDEPWGAWVRGHVSQETFDKAILELIDMDEDARENGEDWLWESDFDADGEPYREVKASPEHSFMRLDRRDDPEIGDVYKRCKATDPGAFPITVAMY